MKRIFYLLLAIFVLFHSKYSKAQHPWISTAGGVVAGGGGIPVHGNVGGAQDQPVMVTTSVRDGIIIAWEDNRPTANNVDIYAQKLDPCGNIMWTGFPNGRPITTSVRNQDRILMLPDGGDGAIIIWEDDIVSGAQQDIYAQRIDGSGNLLWSTPAGVVVNAEGNAQQNPSACTDGAGGAIITWDDNRPGSNGRDVYAQRLLNNGTLAWTATGVPIAIANNAQQFPEIVEDGSGGAVIVFEDGRPGSNSLDIYAQKIDASGNTAWGNGMLITDLPNNQKQPQVVNNGGGFFTVVFESAANVWAKRIDATGASPVTAAGWAATGNVGGICSNNGVQSHSLRAITNARGEVFTPFHGNDGIDLGVYSRKFGVVPTPILADYCYNPWGREDVCEVASDPSGGGDTVLTVYRQGPHSISPTEGIWAHYSNNTNLRFLVSPDIAGANDDPAISASGNYFYFAFEDRRPSSINSDIYAAALDTLAAPARIVASAGPYCLGDNITFTAVLPAGLFNNYEFFVDSVSTQNGASNVFSTSSLTAGMHTITVTATTANGCATRSSNIVNVDVGCILSIDLLAFEAEKLNKNVKLNWSTSSETNSDFYTVEKSYDLEDWESIGEIKGAGNSNEKLDYEYFDFDARFGINHYRLKQTNFDKSSHYSDVKTVDFHENNSEIQIYPNPTSGQLTINLPIISEEITYLKITDMVGRILNSQKVTSNQIIYNLQDEANGFYFIQIESGNSNQIFKVIKQ